MRGDVTRRKTGLFEVHSILWILAGLLAAVLSQLPTREAAGNEPADALRLLDEEEFAEELRALGANVDLSNAELEMPRYILRIHMTAPWHPLIVAAFRKFGRLTQLESLELVALGLDDHELEFLPRLQTLKRVSVIGQYFTDETVLRIAKLQNLRSVALCCPEGTVTNECMRQFAKLPELTTLAAFANDVDDDGIVPWRGNSKLKSLQLLYSNVSNRGVKDIASMRGLTTLMLHASRIDNDAIGELASLPALETLHLEFTRIDSAGLVAFKDYKTIVNLSLRGANINDAGLESFPAVPTLRKLNLENTSVTRAGRKSLQARMPELFGGRR